MFGIENARKEILEFLGMITDEESFIKREESEWSIMENLEHLYLIERYMTAEIVKILEQDEKQKAKRQKPLQSTLDRSKKYPAPPIFEPKEISENLDQARGKLAASRQELLQALAKYQKGDLASTSGKHLAFGTISLKQWIEFIGLHERRHLMQMKEILTKE